jgi:hypothetical protein
LSLLKIKPGLARLTVILVVCIFGKAPSGAFFVGKDCKKNLENAAFLWWLCNVLNVRYLNTKIIGTEKFSNMHHTSFRNHMADEIKVLHWFCKLKFCVKADLQT